jgi:UDP-glucose 4-epimerase
MEKIMVARARQKTPGGTILCGTRYGNVMGSRGSVIPLFVQQVIEGQPITVTDPNMTRFMMSIEDAVDLVLFAYQHGTPGDIFVQKAPAVTIGTLAQAVKTVFDAPNPIRIIGTRHGEKLFETLLTREERVKAQDMGSYFRVPADNRDLNYNVYFAEGQETLSHEEDYHSHNTQRLDMTGMIELLLKLDYVREHLDVWRRRGRVTGAPA